jgi:hypothetical protein
VHRDAVYHYMPIDQDMVGWEEFKQHIVGGCQALPGLAQEWEFIAGTSITVSQSSLGLAKEAD